MIAELLKFSLVKRLTETRTLSIHRLVQAVQMDTMEPEVQCQWAERVVRAVNEVFPDNPHDMATWAQCLLYLDQVQACNTLIEQYTLQFVEAAHLLTRTGFYLSEHASYTIAEPLLQRALAIREKQLGPEHPDTASSLQNLASLYRDQGKYEQAEPLYQRALAIREKALGPEYPDLAQWLNNLATFYHDQGKYKQAEPLYQRAIGEKKLSPEHSGMKTLLKNYARFLEEKKQRSRSLRLYLMALVATLLTLIGVLFLLVLNNATTGYRIVDFGMATFAFQQALANRWISDDPAKSAEVRFFAGIRSNVSVYLAAAIAVGLGIAFPNVYSCFVVAVLVLWIGGRTMRRGRS